DVITSLQPAPGQAFVDATLGGGGYARALIERLRPGGVLLGIDRDATAIERFAQEPVPPDITLMLEHTNFAQLDRAAERIGRPASRGAAASGAIEDHEGSRRRRRRRHPTRCLAPRHSRRDPHLYGLPYRGQPRAGRNRERVEGCH